jgi:hypothetical protein
MILRRTGAMKPFEVRLIEKQGHKFVEAVGGKALIQIKTAAVVSRDQIRGKFGEFVVETNRGFQVRVFFDRQEAESWLLCD